jgi:hypothetical protein
MRRRRQDAAMRELDEKRLRRWLEAEDAGASDAADRLFGAVAAAHLSRIDVPAGFADRVLAALPEETWTPARPAWDLAASWWARLTAIAAVGILGIGLALVTPGHVIALGLEAFSLAARGLDGVVASLAAAAGVWRASLDLLGALGQAAGHLAVTGIGPLLIAANLAVAVAAFAGLKHLLAPQEECV